MSLSVAPGGAGGAGPLELHKLPVGLTYYQFLRDHYPVGDGEPMEMGLNWPLGSSNVAPLKYYVLRRAHDEWIGVPGHEVATTDEFFRVIKQQLQGADTVTFRHEKDPSIVKKEQVEAGVEPQPIRFRSFSEPVDLLESGDEEDPDAALFGEVPEGRGIFERRHFSMAVPEHLQTEVTTLRRRRMSSSSWYWGGPQWCP